MWDRDQALSAITPAGSCSASVAVQCRALVGPCLTLPIVNSRLQFAMSAPDGAAVKALERATAAAAGASLPLEGEHYVSIHVFRRPF